ncbi:MAG: Ig-like domain-containing protein [Chloroflexota bacterium]
MLVLIALLAGCNLHSGTPTPIPTPNIPTVQFQFPTNNSTILEGVDLDIDLLATDPGTGIARVELLIDDQPHQEGKPEVSPEVPTFTVKMNWLVQGVGTHSLTAVAYRLDGTASAPQTIIVDVVARQ